MKEKLLQLLNDKSYILSSYEELANQLNLTTEEELLSLSMALIELQKDYIIAQTKKHKYGLLKDLSLVKGYLSIMENGNAFLRVEKKDLDKDVYIERKNLAGSLQNDYVLVRYDIDEKGYHGVVINIIKRASEKFIGVIKKYHGNLYCQNIDLKNSFSALIKQNPLNAKSGDIVCCSVTKYFQIPTDVIGVGIIKEIIGQKTDDYMDIKTYLINKNIDLEFDNDVLKEVKELPNDVDLSTLANRTDKTDDIIVTIDGDDAKDFDDAICVKKDGDDYLLSVHIADVSSYVKENSHIDKEALKRGCSIYTPGMVVPMLPFKLSDDLCSLNPGKIRLTLSVDMKINKNGVVTDSNIYESYIKSTQRLTYNVVNSLYNKEEPNLDNDIKAMLFTALDLSLILKNNRIKNGAFDFETDETELILDKHGKCVDVRIKNRGIAEMMIEEFMLKANEVVAKTIGLMDYPFIYRIHEKPNYDKMEKFIKLISPLGYTVDTRNDLTIQKSLKEIYDNSSESEKPFIANILVKTMEKARYDVFNYGHFGLALKYYTHFTSPIRRYPDLIVHRLIKKYLLNKNTTQVSEVKLEQIAISSSERETLSQKIEWDLNDMKCAEYMEKHIGETYNAVIVSLTQRGLFVKTDQGIEGFVDYYNLPYDNYFIDDDYTIITGYNYEFKLFTKVIVKLITANKETMHIDFKILKIR